MTSAYRPGLGSPQRTGADTDPLIGYRTDALAFEALLGAGAMGAVYRAHHLRLDRVVAVKIIASHLAANQAYVERFDREARTLARLHHQHIVTCHDFGPMVGPDGKLLLIMVMEFVDGQSIRELANQAMTVRDALDLYRQSAEGLIAAHVLNVVHRDVKPDNIMVTRNGMAKLADFGLAKADDSAGLTAIGTTLGTPAYMAPEVCLGKEPTRASDVYSLGCSLYHTLTGESLYRSASSLETIQCHISVPAPRLSERAPHLTLLDPLLAKILVKDPAKRLDAAAFARDLARITALLPVEAMTIPGDDARHGRIAELATLATDAVDRHGNPLVADATDLTGGPLDENASDARIPDAQQARSLKSLDGPQQDSDARDASQRGTDLGDAHQVREIDLGLDGAAAPKLPESSSAGRAQPFAIPEHLQVQPELPPLPPVVAGPVSYARAADAADDHSEKTFEKPASDDGAGARNRDTAKNPSAGNLIAKGSARPDAKPTQPDHGAAEKQRVAEAKGHETRGDLHAAEGRWLDAISAYESGAKAAHTEVARHQLQAKAAEARVRLRRKRTLVATGGAVIVVAAVFGTWLAMSGPAPADAVPASVSATPSSAPLPSVAPVVPAGHAGGSALERMVDDQKVDWLTIRDEGERLLPSAGGEAGDDAERVRRVLERATIQAGPIETEIRAIDALRTTDPVEALVRSERFRIETERIGTLARRLPLPGSVVVRGPDAGAITLEVSGVVMPAASGLRFCRSATGLTRLDVKAIGYRPASLIVPPDATPGERVYTVDMTDAPSWTVASALGDWAQIARRPDAFLAVSAHAVWLGDPLDGKTLAKLEPAELPVAPKFGFAWLPSRDMDADTVCLSGDDGLGFAMHATDRGFADTRIVHLGDPPALAFGERELLFHVGKRACFSIERSAERSRNEFALVASSDGQRLWTYSLTGTLDPWLRVDDESVMAIDEGSVCILDQEGQLLQSLPLAAIRNGPVTSVADGACLIIPTTSGTRLLQRKADGRFQELPVPELGQGHPLFASQGSRLLIASGSSLQLRTWTGNGFAQEWAVSLAKGRVGSEISISETWVSCCDDALSVSVFDASSGRLLRSLRLADPPIAPPVVIIGMLVVADVKGLSGYALSAQK